MFRSANAKNLAVKALKKCGWGAYWLSLLHCVLEYCGDFVFCKGQSMEPTIRENDIVVAEKVSSRLKNLKRGDVVITKHPTNPNFYICKRIIALPGDKISSLFSSQIIPDGYVWLEGDNKYNSADSRMFGPIPLGLITGRVVFRVWPFSNMRWLTVNSQQSS